MKLTSKDKDFLNKLRRLLEEKDLVVDSVQDGLTRFQLRQNYGDKIELCFGMTRQGVRWRFNHVFNKIYVEALMAVLMVESEFGTALRQQAIAIARERIALYQEARKRAHLALPRRQPPTKTEETDDPQLTRDSPS